jgi:hypothetical protein
MPNTDEKPSAVADDPTARGPERVTPEDPHRDAPNFGEEGGSSEWGQRVLTADGIKQRTVSRDAGTGKRK